MFSAQNNRFLTLINAIINNIDNSIIKIIYFPTIIFQVIEIIAVNIAEIKCTNLSSPKYFGVIPTIDKVTTDKKDKN